MKHYPSTIRINPSGDNMYYYTFDKLDGSQIRAEYSRKTGFYKFGSRQQLLDKNDPVLGGAIEVFMNNWAEPLTEVFHNNKWVQATAFLEYYGLRSFAGRHVPGEEKKLTLFDVSVHRQGFLPPDQFLQHFKYLPTATFLGIRKWDETFIRQVKEDRLEGVSFEGIVGKVQEATDIIRVKCKTQKWIDKVQAIHSADIARQIINS